MNDQLVVKKYKEERIFQEEKVLSKVILTFEYDGMRYRLVFYNKDLKGSKKKWIFFLDQLQGEEFENILYYNTLLEEDIVFDIEPDAKDLCIDIFLSEELLKFFSVEELITLVHRVRETIK